MLDFLQGEGAFPPEEGLGSLPGAGPDVEVVERQVPAVPEVRDLPDQGALAGLARAGWCCGGIGRVGDR